MCGKNYRDHATLQGGNEGKGGKGVAEAKEQEQEQEQEEEEVLAEPSLPLRHKRPSEVNVDAETNGHQDEGGQDTATHATKRRRRSSGRHNRHTVDSAGPNSTHNPSRAPHLPIEYTDISSEVEARLAAREQRRRERSAQSASSKRKRRSSLGDSLYLGASDDERGEGAGMSRMERKMERARRISAGGTRQVKRLKTRRRGTDHYVGEAGTSKTPLGGVGAGVGMAAAGVQDGGVQHANGHDGVVRKDEGVKVALNDVDVDGAPAKNAGNIAESKAKKRRRSSFVRSQGQDAESGGNKHALDDRSTKRRRR